MRLKFENMLNELIKNTDEIYSEQTVWAIRENIRTITEHARIEKVDISDLFPLTIVIGDITLKFFQSGDVYSHNLVYITRLYGEF